MSRHSGTNPGARHLRAGPALCGVLVLVAQGFGLGARLPAPGTWGSILGLGLTALLLWPGSYGLFVMGIVVGLVTSVPICTAAERALAQKDPGSIVLDELMAQPLCYLGWVTDLWLRTGRCSVADLLVQSDGWWLAAAGFLVFRLLDVAKPWPIRATQRWPGGWGVVADDVLAALATALVVLLLSWMP